MNIYIEVVNPKGLQVTIDESRWIELSKKGYKKIGGISKFDLIEDEEYLVVEEI